MTFYEMLGIMGADGQADLEQILRQEKWKIYLDLHNSGIEMVREPLISRYHAPVPEELAIAAVSASKWRFRREGNLLWSLGVAKPSANSLNALEAYQQFGGAVLDEAIERGRTEIPRVRK